MSHNDDFISLYQQYTGIRPLYQSIWLNIIIAQGLKYRACKLHITFSVFVYIDYIKILKIISFNPKLHFD